MAELLSCAPEGFLPASDSFCCLPKDVQQRMCLLAFEYLQGKISSRDFKFSNIGFREDECTDQKQQQSILSALVYLFRSAAKLNYSGEELSRQLLSTAVWKQEAVDIVSSLWKEQSSKLLTTEPSTSFLNVGKLLDVQWKVGMAVSSSNCKNLNSSFITMTITFADPKGNIITKSFEMTVPEFRKFSLEIRDLACALETN